MPFPQDFQILFFLCLIICKSLEQAKIPISAASDRALRNFYCVPLCSILEKSYPSRAQAPEIYAKRLKFTDTRGVIGENSLFELRKIIKSWADGIWTSALIHHRKICNERFGENEFSKKNPPMKGDQSLATVLGVKD
jgi:hypothetical protein